MLKIIENPGLQHLAQRMLIYLDKGSIASFRFANQDCKNIIDDPMFSLKKLSQLEDVPKDLIQDWKKIIQKLHGNDDVKQVFTTELFKMYCKSDAKYPLELAYKLAESKDKPELVVAILENSNPKSYTIAPEIIYGNMRPIHIASAFGYVQVAKNLITGNSSIVDFQDEHGITPLFLAARHGYLDMVQLLLTFSGNANIFETKYGTTPIYQAARKGYINVVQLLLTTTDTPNAPAIDGRTPIFDAAFGGHIDVVRLLMSTTDTPNAPDINGRTPIMIAQLNNHHEIVKLLSS